MGLRFSLKEHKPNAPDAPEITFSKPSGSILRISSTISSTGEMYVFITGPTAFLHNKYLRIRWRGDFPSGNWLAQMVVNDGSYDRSSDTDFPPGSNVITKGNGSLDGGFFHIGNFGWTTEEKQLKLFGGGLGGVPATLDNVTIMLAISENQDDEEGYWEVDWIQINEGSGGSGNLYLEEFTDSVHMELTGTEKDYGYIGDGELYGLDDADLFVKGKLGQEIENLFGKGIIRHSDSGDLFADGIIRHSADKDLFTDGGVAHFERLFADGIIRHSAEGNLFGKGIIRHSGSGNLYNKGIIRHADSETLFIKGIIRHSAIRDLFADGGIAHWERLFAKGIITHWEDLFAKGLMRYGYGNIFCDGIIRHTAIKNLFGKGETAQWEDIFCKGVIRHSNELDLKATGSIEQTYIELFCKGRIIHSATFDVFGKGSILNAGSAQLFAKARINPVKQLFAKGIIRNTTEKDLFCKGSIGTVDAKNLFAKGEIRYGYENLFCKGSIVQDMFDLITHDMYKFLNYIEEVHKGFIGSPDPLTEETDTPTGDSGAIATSIFGAHQYKEIRFGWKIGQPFEGGDEATIFPFQRKLLYANGYYYIFYSDGDKIVYRSSSDGITWSNPYTVKTYPHTGTALGEDFSFTFDGTYIHCAWAQGTISPADRGLEYRRGKPKANGEIEWTTAYWIVAYTSGGTEALYRPHICIDSNGYPWIGFFRRNFTFSTIRPVIIKNVYKDGSDWTNDFAPYDLTFGSETDDSWVVSPQPLTGGKIYAVFVGQNQGLKGRLYNAGWGAIESYGTDYPKVWNFSATSIGDIVHLAYTDRADPASIRYLKRDGSWGSEEVIASDVEDIDNPVISMHGSIPYVMWSKANDHIYYAYKNGAWSSAIDWIEASNALAELEVLNFNYRGQLTSYKTSLNNRLLVAYETDDNYIHFQARDLTTLEDLPSEGFDLTGIHGIGFYWWGSDVLDQYVEFEMWSPSGYWRYKFVDNGARWTWIYIPITAFTKSGLDGSEPDLSNVTAFLWTYHSNGTRKVAGLSAWYVPPPDLKAIGTIRHSASTTLYAKGGVAQPGSNSLFAKGIITHWEELKAIGTIRYGTGNLFGKGIIQNANTKDLFCKGTVGSIITSDVLYDAGQTILDTEHSWQGKAFYAHGKYWVFYALPGNVYYKTSNDGENWSGATSITTSIDTFHFQDFALYFDGTYVHYVVTGGSALKYRRGEPQADGSISWDTAEQNIGGLPSFVNTADLTVDSNGYAWIVYGYNDIYVLKNANLSGVWSTDSITQLTTGASGANASIIALTGGKLYVVWADSNDQLHGEYYNGSAWSSELGTLTMGEQRRFDVTVYGDVVLLTWQDNSSDIKFKERDGTWGATKNVIAGHGRDIPTISHDGAGTYYIFSFRNAASAIRRYSSTDNGDSWAILVLETGVKPIFCVSGFPVFPEAMSSKIALIWVEHPTTTCGFAFGIYLNFIGFEV